MKKTEEKATKEMVGKAMMGEENHKPSEPLMGKEIHEPSEPLVYCGPSFPGGSIQQFSVYKNGIPEHAKAVEEACPSLTHLFKPVSKLAETRGNLDKTGSRDYQLYQTVLNYFNEKGGVNSGI